MKLGRHVLGRLLKARRLQRNLTTYQVGERLGVGHNAISMMETGQLGVPARRLRQLATILDLDHADLLKWHVICSYYDQGVDLEELAHLDQFSALLTPTTGTRGAVLPAVGGARPGEPINGPGGPGGPMDADVARALQTLKRLARRDDLVDR